MKKDKLKAVIYSRVSTQEQSTANQTEALIGLAENRGYHVSEIYSEQETAWKSGHQRELARLISNAQRHQFDLILVWSLDRLSREGALAILELVNKFSRWGIRLYSYQEPWTEAPGELAELLFALTGWVARMESQRQSERTKAGIERARIESGPKKRKAGTWGRQLGTLDKKKRKRRVKKGAA